MDYMMLKVDLDLMVEASRRVWHVDNYMEIKKSAEAIEKLIDKEEPRMINMERPDANIYYCPSCNKELLYEEYNRCWECGQALKWF